MRLAYADPPYPRQARRFYKDDPNCAEVDHKALIEMLADTYDGWALSSSADLQSMQYIVPLLPEGTRVCAWVKPFASYKPNVTLAYAWEPIYIKPARKRPRSEKTMKDWVAANITLRKGLAGAKPWTVCDWLFDALGAERDDELDDLYPGTGIVTERWQVFTKQATQIDLLKLMEAR